MTAALPLSPLILFRQPTQSVPSDGPLSGVHRSTGPPAPTHLAPRASMSEQHTLSDVSLHYTGGRWVPLMHITGLISNKLALSASWWCSRCRIFYCSYFQKCTEAYLEMYISNIHVYSRKILEPDVNWSCPDIMLPQIYCTSIVIYSMLVNMQ